MTVSQEAEPTVREMAALSPLRATTSSEASAGMSSVLVRNFPLTVGFGVGVTGGVYGSPPSSSPPPHARSKDAMAVAKAKARYFILFIVMVIVYLVFLITTLRLP